MAAVTDDTGLEWSSVQLTLHQDASSQAMWWQVDEVVTGELLHHELNTTTSAMTSRERNDVIDKTFLTFISFSERVPTGVLSFFDNYGSVSLLCSHSHVFRNPKTGANSKICLL